MGSTVQFWGLGSGLSNTAELIEAMLISDTQKVTGYQNKITLANNKKSAWNELKNSIESMNTIIKNLSGVDKQNYKTATTSSDGYLKASVTNKAINMDYTVNVKQLASKHTVSGNKVDDINASLNSSGKFTINGTEIEVSSTDSLSDVMKKINNTKDVDGNSIGAKAYIINGVLVLESEQTGIDNSLKIEDTNGILKQLGLVKADGDLNTTKEAKNAIVEVNGIEIERNSNSINDAIEGVTLNLTKVTNDSITLSVKNDTESLKTTITDFINAYNNLITKMSTYTAYNATSGTSGILNGDSSINTIKNTLSGVMQSSFAGGSMSYLFDMGISVDNSGKYQIDETKFKDALENKSEEVLNFFTKGLENPTSSADSSSGLFVSMKSAINKLTGGTNNIFTAKESSIDSQIKTYNNLIDKTNAYIEKRKATLEAQFAALETTMNSLNNTASMLTQMSNSNKDD